MEELLDSQVQQQNSCDTDLIKIADGILLTPEQTLGISRLFACLSHSSPP